MQLEPAINVNEMYPEHWGAIGDDSTDCGAAITSALATGLPITFAPGRIYRYATSPNFAVTNAMIKGNGATLKHTGSGNAFVMDAGAVSGDVGNLNFSDLVIQGNTNSTNGIFLRACHRCLFNNLRVTGAAASGAALLTNSAVTNLWINFKCTINDPYVTPMPTNGIYLSRRGTNEWTTTQTFINPIIEGLTGAGITCDYAVYNKFEGGTSESNGTGLVLTTNGYQNTIDSTDFEANTLDVSVTSYRNTFLNVAAGIAWFFDGGVNNTWIGGRIHDQLVCDTFGVGNTFIGVSLWSNISDTTGNNTYINTFKVPNNAVAFPFSFRNQPVSRGDFFQ